MGCVNCGYRKAKYISCEICNGFVCNQCISKGMCKDCFNITEVEHYKADYKYNKNEDYLKC